MFRNEITINTISLRSNSNESLGRHGREKERGEGRRKKEKKKNVRLCRLRAQGDNQETKEEK